jgi:hypothetical protein
MTDRAGTRLMHSQHEPGRALGRPTVLAPLAVMLLGSAMCAQTSPRPSEAENDAGPVWEAATELVRGEAFRGPWQMNASDYRWVDDPTVDVANSGEIAVAWVDQSRKSVLFQRYGKNGEPRLPQPTDVSRSSEIFSWLPKVVVAPDDPKQVYIAWQEIVFSGGSHGGEIFFARSSDAGKTFGTPANLSKTEAGAGKGRLDESTWDNGSLDLARGPGGQVYVAWTEYEGGLWLRRSANGGKTFSEPVRIGDESHGPARGPSIGVGPRGALHVAWAVGDDPSANLRIASSADAGRTFGPVRTVLESDGHSDAPKIAVDRRGTVHLVYAEGTSGPGREYHIRYSRLRSGANDFEESRRVPDTQKTKSAHYPEVELDDQGRVYVLWEQHADGRQRPRGLGFTYSLDGGDSFAACSPVPGIAGNALGFNGSQQGLLMDKLAVNDAGAMAVVNSTFRPGEVSQIWLARGRLRD